MAFRFYPSISPRYFGLIFGGIWLFVGLTFLFVGANALKKERAFAENSVVAEAKVLTRDITRARRSGDDGGSSTSYVVSYRFTSADGAVVTGSNEVDVDVWESLSEQGPVLVEYLPDDPASNRVAGNVDHVSGWLMTAIGGVLTLAGAVIFGWSARSRWITHRLMKSGLAAQASVIAVEPTSVSINRQPQWRIRYQYQDFLGRNHEGKSAYVSRDEAERWRQGDSGSIRYDRQRAEKSVWIG